MIYEILKRNKNILILSIFYIKGFWKNLLFLIHSVKHGGNPWNQGDWLINNELVEVRRGLLGSLILHTSDLINFNPLYLLAIIQIIMVFLIYTIFLYIGEKLKNNDVVFFLLFSPLFILFWFNDPNGGMRKEIIAYLAFAPFLIAALRQNKNIMKHILLSLLIYSISVFSHEGNIFFFPFFITAIYIIRQKLDNFFILSAISYLLISIFGFLYAINHSSIDNYMLVCQPLLDRGLNKIICGGAISWLNMNSNDAISKTKDLLFSKASLNFLISYIFSLLFFTYTLKKYFPVRLILTLCILSSLCFLPLYIIAIDWGRWINFYIVSLTSLLLIHFLYNKDIYEYKQFSKYEFFILLLFCCLFSMPHSLPPSIDSIIVFHGYIH